MESASSLLPTSIDPELLLANPLSRDAADEVMASFLQVECKVLPATVGYNIQLLFGWEHVLSNITRISTLNQINPSDEQIQIIDRWVCLEMFPYLGRNMVASMPPTLSMLAPDYDPRPWMKLCQEVKTNYSVTQLLQQHSNEFTNIASLLKNLYGETLLPTAIELLGAIFARLNTSPEQTADRHEWQALKDRLLQQLCPPGAS